MPNAFSVNRQPSTANSQPLNAHFQIVISKLHFEFLHSLPLHIRHTIPISGFSPDSSMLLSPTEN
jgi:hypothetical protein